MNVVRLPLAPPESSTRLRRRELASVTSIARPRTRRDCEEGGANAARPCPWASCRYHLLFDRKRRDRGEPAELEHSCSLDIADEGGMSQEKVAEILNVTLEPLQKVEKRALARFYEHARRLRLPLFEETGS